MHIENLYKHPDFLDPTKKVYALEKIHGTSSWVDFSDKQTLKAHKKGLECKVSYSGGYKLSLYSGGEKGESFAALFNQLFLHDAMYNICAEKGWFSLRIHGEAYGGRQQKMSLTYGPKLKFVVFDLKVNDEYFLNVPEAEGLTKRLNLEFVHYTLGNCDPLWLDEQMKEISIQAIRNGMGPGKEREGIVIRPLIEEIDKFDQRVIFKHKNANFSEVKTGRVLGEKAMILKDTFKIIDEWLTDERMSHVADRLIRDREDKTIVIKDVGAFINLMVEDIKRESDGEVVWSPELERKIRKRTGIMFQTIYKPSKKVLIKAHDSNETSQNLTPSNNEAQGTMIEDSLSNETV